MFIKIFEKYPPSAVLFLTVGVAVALAVNGVCGVALMATWWIGHGLDTFGVRR